jgi:branched-chain amino acid aminotransferase
VLETCRRNRIRDGYIRLLVTRGVRDTRAESEPVQEPVRDGDCGQDPAVSGPELYDEGMEIVTVPTTRNLHNALNPAIKSLNYLNNVLAKIEANNAGVEEAIMLNSRGVCGRVHRRQHLHRVQGQTC